MTVEEKIQRGIELRREGVKWLDVGVELQLPPGLIARLVGDAAPELADPQFPPIPSPNRGDFFKALGTLTQPTTKAHSREVRHTKPLGSRSQGVDSDRPFEESA